MIIQPATSKDVKYLVHLAKQNAYAIGFIPKCRYEDIAENNSLHQHIVVAFENTDPVGFCYYTRNKGIVKIQQLCIQEDARREERATRIISDISEINDMFIQLRCATDLESISFWESLDFEKINLVDGGKRNNRKIQVFGKTIGGLFMA